MATLAPRLNAVEAREIIEAKKIQIRQLHKKVRKRIDQNVRLEEEISALERDREDIVRASTHENESQAPMSSTKARRTTERKTPDDHRAEFIAIVRELDRHRRAKDVDWDTVTTLGVDIVKVADKAQKEIAK